MRVLACLLAMLLPGAVAGAEPPPLQKNPFSRPPAPAIPEVMRGNAESRSTTPVLVATMVSTRGAFANVDGIVLRPGQEIHGYLLKRVYENRAVFERNGDEVTVFVKPELEEDNDQAIQNSRSR
jgi:hypothetical protein